MEICTTAPIHDIIEAGLENCKRVDCITGLTQKPNLESAAWSPMACGATITRRASYPPRESGELKNEKIRSLAQKRREVLGLILEHTGALRYNWLLKFIVWAPGHRAS